MSGRIRIRAATAGDAAEIAAAVEGQALLARYGTTREGLEQAIGGAIDRGEGVVVAEDVVPAVDVHEGGRSKVVGFAWYLTTGTFARGGYLRLIALAPGTEGGGIGGLLLDEVERAVGAESRVIFLLASDFNDGARRFYARRGYVEAGVIGGFVREGIDEVVMWKRLG